ncbi:uncharacterized protein LOC129591075 [Paramacrobiotus metropolitanus]|uniref:uncharacterized protein LOC129591075 n=1 Tax=Paramacrobiotus metropolitanus TaxID=2943436 RepID=UPI0024459135|nr:uncharacterized protein LOC129591075 [Paramacrobiotus metropolitanus]
MTHQLVVIMRSLTFLHYSILVLNVFAGFSAALEEGFEVAINDSLADIGQKAASYFSQAALKGENATSPFLLAMKNPTPPTTTTTTTTQCSNCHSSGKPYCTQRYAGEHPCFGDPFMILLERADLGGCLEKIIWGGPGTEGTTDWAWNRPEFWYSIPVKSQEGNNGYHRYTGSLGTCSTKYLVSIRKSACNNECRTEVAYFIKGSPKIPKNH